MHRSHVFYSDSSEHLALAFTVPIWGLKPGSTEELVIGVLGITANFGHFAVLQAPDTEEKDRVAVLVDTLPDGSKPPRRGLILEHGHRDELVKHGEVQDAENYIATAEIERLNKLRKLAAENVGEKESPTIERYAVQDHYVDPVQPSAGRWLAAFEPVFVDGRPKAVSDTGLVVIVQERFDDAVRPARQLGQHLVKRGLLTAAVVVALRHRLVGIRDHRAQRSPTLPHWSRIAQGTTGCHDPSKSPPRKQLRREEVASKEWLVASGQKFC